jgi:hypothetical protein
MFSTIHLRALGFTVISCVWVATGSTAQKDFNVTESFPSSEGKKLVVDAADLDLTLRTADVPGIEAEVQLHISGTGEDKAQGWIDSHTPVFTDSEDRLGVVVNPGKSGFLGFGKLTARARLGLLVPGGVVPNITTTKGSIQVRGDFPEARPLMLRSMTGDMKMVGAAGGLLIDGADGDVDIEVFRPLDVFDASTSSGDVRLVGGAREVEVGTASGKIWLENISGSIDVSTSTGKVNITWDRLGTDDTVRIRSSSGRVQLVVPEGVHPRGTLTTTTGSIRSELPGEVVGDGSTLQLSGDGPVFDVETASAEIVLSISEIRE